MESKAVSGQIRDLVPYFAVQNLFLPSIEKTVSIGSNISELPYQWR
jgi:hypothetical protein